ncbi:angiogenic factor with G patch and FHA domains 1 isoform X2 [Cryptotermes secundus]|uniref:angiogenic factor with G patch and FHA domains 1 isoform X2 n=1 Tax=Cryptotermes secundus TaxID=105785 RepID=UPI001454CA28|nr:angiogenic factor with G patch and FHA domains 1 isoform X2 [Cryptotermes secundus]
MSDSKFASEMVEQDASRDSESDSDIPSDFGICPCEAELERLPEVVRFIKRLQSFLYRQQSKLDKIRKQLKEHKVKKRKKCTVATQTEEKDVVHLEATQSWSNKEEEEKQSLAEQVKEAAQNAMQLTGFVYEETSGMYYDYNTGYYYSAELGLYYDGNSGSYYYYDDKSKSFQFHSQVEGIHMTPASSYDVTCSSGVKYEEHESRRKSKHKGHKESKKVKHDRSCEHDSNNSGTESLEEGECSNSSGEEGTSCSGASGMHDMDIDQEVSKAWPPCIRIIVKETNIEQLKIGTLFIVTCTGGTVGREGDHAVSIPDINISKHHAKFTFDEALGKYYVIDYGSRNGTFLNGKRLSVAKQESDPHEVIHGSLLQVGGTKLLCHIHAGQETCGHCEPGLVQQANVTPGEEKTGKESKKHCHRKELRRIRRKFGLESSEPNIKAISVPGYEDRAQIRRTTVGSQDPHEKTQTASLEEPIHSDNKGFKLLAKMGWSEGQALGKDGDGCVEPDPFGVERQVSEMEICWKVSPTIKVDGPFIYK